MSEDATPIYGVEGWVAFLSKPRTHAEINRRLRRVTDREGIFNIQLLPGYELFEQKNDKGESIYLAAKQGMKPPDRLWHLWKSPTHEPYVWIQFPHTFDAERICVVPLSDVHYGARAHNLKRFKSYLDWIAANDDVYTFLNGDIIENAIDGSIGGAVYESILTPEEQIWGTLDGREPGIIELLRPIAHKILWSQPGNHEWRTWKKTNIDPLRIVSQELKIPHFSEPVYADLLAWGHRFTFYCHHGTTGSNTKGGKLNAAARPVEFQESLNFVVMGHVHDSTVNQITRIARKRNYGNNGLVTSFGLEERIQYVVICPSFHGYFSSYGSRAGYAPGSWGAVNCTVYKNGTYRASE